MEIERCLGIESVRRRVGQNAMEVSSDETVRLILGAVSRLARSWKKKKKKKKKIQETEPLLRLKQALVRGGQDECQADLGVVDCSFEELD